MRAASDDAMAPTLGSPMSAISRAAPAVSAWTTGCSRFFFRKLRHWASAWTWLLTVRIDFSDAPGRATRQCSTRWKCSATIFSFVCGSRLCRSATRPAIEFSTGMMASSALPAWTAPMAASKVGHGRVVM